MAPRLFTEQDQELLTRVTVEARTYGKENTRLRNELIILTREAHGFAYMLLKAEFALKVEKVESQMLREQLDATMNIVDSLKEALAKHNNGKSNTNGHSRTGTNGSTRQVGQPRQITNGSR